MTAKDGFYGRDNVDYRKNLVPNSNEAYFLQINEETGDMEVWNEEFGSDKYVGVYKKGEDGKYGEFEENENWWGGASNEEKQFFKSDKGLKATKEFAVISIKKDLADADITDEVQTDAAANKNAQEFIDDGKMTTDPNATNEEVAAQTAQEGLDKVNQEAEALINSQVAQARTNTRKGPGSFGDHSYPLDRNQSQDFMKFTLLEYKPKKVGGGASGGGFGFADRERVGPNGKPPGRTILGSVSLPIPGGIKDENGCDWAGNTMDEVAIQAGALARAATGASGTSAVDEANAIVGRLGNNSDVVKKAIQETFAGKAVGVKNLMTRSTGLIFNPNLELLFDKPVLRGFQFSFDLIPRSQKEAEEVVKIIRFFKQGMAAIRSESNLFLLSPNVFQVHYVLNGDGSKDHPYIGKMKECAMTDDYTADRGLKVYKFEKDYGKKAKSPLNNPQWNPTGQYLEYEFYRSFPISINSMPVSYEAANLLKCTVSMNYIRYTVRRSGDPSIASDSPTESSQTPPAASPVQKIQTAQNASASLGGSTNGPGTQFADRDSASGGSSVNDGPLLLPDGSPAYDSSGRLRSMF